MSTVNPSSNIGLFFRPLAAAWAMMTY
jgi:hypothetical protein